jgi:hypothetical protein
MPVIRMYPGSIQKNGYWRIRTYNCRFAASRAYEGTTE